MLLKCFSLQLNVKRIPLCIGERPCHRVMDLLKSSVTCFVDSYDEAGRTAEDAGHSDKCNAEIISDLPCGHL